MSVPDPTATPPPPAIDPAEFQKLQQINADQARALAMAQTKLEFPKADPALLESFQGTPEALRGFAEKLQAHEQAREAALPPAVPAPAPGPGNATNPEDQASARYNELRTKVLVYRNAEPYERDEFERAAFAKSWNQHQADRKAGRSGA